MNTHHLLEIFNSMISGLDQPGNRESLEAVDRNASEVLNLISTQKTATTLFSRLSDSSQGTALTID